MNPLLRRVLALWVRPEVRPEEADHDGTVPELASLAELPAWLAAHHPR